LRGVCINPERTDLMEKGKTYYLFPNGPDHVYVSRFDNPGAHFGCFERSRFNELTEEKQADPWPPEPPVIIPNLDREKLYKARLIWRESFYKGKELGEYYITPLESSCFFYRNPGKERFCGCFPIHWFEGFAEVETVTAQFVEHGGFLAEGFVIGINGNQETERLETELPPGEWEQLDLFSI
jgi:hypothetical protein